MLSLARFQSDPFINLVNEHKLLWWVGKCAFRGTAKIALAIMTFQFFIEKNRSHPPHKRSTAMRKSSLRWLDAHPTIPT